MENKTKITFIGAGNLAWNLANALQGTDFSIVEVKSATAASAKELAEAFKIQNYGTLASPFEQKTDIIWILTPDDAIASIAEKLQNMPVHPRLFIHSSGATPLKVLEPLGENIGVLYPLQTFTKDTLISFDDIPIFLECTGSGLSLLQALATTLSQSVTHINSLDREKIHIGAVWSSNFTVLLWHIAQTITAPHEINLYAPLIKQAMEQTLKIGPRKAMTGPAIRGDKKVLKSHLALLNKLFPQYSKIYELISEQIKSLKPK